MIVSLFVEVEEDEGFVFGGFICDLEFFVCNL